MERTFNSSRAAVALTLSNVVVMVINALIGIFIARSLGTFEYGQVAYFMSIFLLATLIGGLGLTSQAMRDIAETYAQRNFGHLNRSFYTLLTIRLGTGMILIVAMAIYSYYEQSIIPVTVGVCAALSMLSDFLTGVLRGVQRIRGLILVLWCQPVLYLLLLMLNHVSSAEQVIIAFGVSFGIAVVVGVLLLIRSTIGLPRRESFSRAYARSSGEFAVQLYGISLLQVAYASAGAFILGSARLYEATGLISIALTIARMMPLVLGPTLGSIFYPQLCADLAGADAAAARKSFAAFYKIFLLIAIGGMAVLIIYPDTAVYTLYTAKYAEAAPILRMLAPISLMMVVDMVFTWTLIAHRATRQTLLILIGRLSALSVGGLLATQGDAQSAPMVMAIAYVVSATLGLVMQGIAVRRITLYPLHLSEVLLVGVVALGLAALCRYVIPDLPIGSIRFLPNALVAGLLYGGIVLMAFYRAWLRSTIGRLFAASPSQAR